MKQSISGKLKHIDCFGFATLAMTNKKEKPRNDSVGQKGSGGTFLTQQAMRLGEDKATEITESHAVV